MAENNNASNYNDFNQKLKDATIMMVDDEPINTEVLQIHLEDAGYKNFVVTDQSTQAIALMQSSRPDVLLLDLSMPEVSGFDILKIIRSDSNLRHIPVIILTSASDSESKLKALELGATDFLSKPADPSELALRLRNALTVKAYHDQLAYYDTLTGLPNRQLFLDRLDWAIKKAQRSGESVAVLHVGFSQFNEISVTYGHKTGDELIKQISERLKACLRNNDVVTRGREDEITNIPARVSSGDFTALLVGMEHIESSSIVAKRIINKMSEAFNIEGNEFFLDTSIGIAAYPVDADEPESLFSLAASSNAYAQEHGMNNFQFYSDEINARSSERLKLETHLRKAIQNEELHLFYQPKVDPNTEKVTGMEALIRWISPELGFISPADFIPLAEETGLIVPIGEWVLNEACRQTKEWQQDGLDGLTISVNVSSEQFRLQDLSQVIQKALKRSGLDPVCLILEITESMIVGNPEQTSETLRQLKDLQLSISIDDFGTGYSSLSYLKKFPLDELKIDRSFIMEVDKDADDKAIVTAIIAMSHSLGLKIVAEGVETKPQLEFLNTLGCDQIQGFFFSKPLPKDEFPLFAAKMNKL